MAAETMLDRMGFRAMGTDAAVYAVGAVDDALDRARRRVVDLEGRWSRFLANSEISRMNRNGGHPVVVSAETITLVDRGMEGWRRTEGAFDPTVLAALIASGYDRTFEDIDEAGPLPLDDIGVPGCAGIRVNRSIRMVMLPQGTGFDPGGLGKGLAADLVAHELLTSGHAAGVCVNLGGDLRVAGEPLTTDGWIVSVEDPLDSGVEIARLALQDGAIATTTSARRHWTRGGVEQHHIIDPVTGRPANRGLLAVTVVAGDAWWAEVLAKAAFLAGPRRAAALLTAAGATGLLVDEDGTLHLVDGVEAFLV